MSTKTPEQIAQATLDAHAIKPNWRRNGEQIAALIAEAIETDRAQNAAEARELAEAFREAAEGDSGDAAISAACDMADYLEGMGA